MPTPEKKTYEIDPSFDLDRFMEYMGKRESWNNYEAVAHAKHKRQFLGRYQLGFPAIKSLGTDTLIEAGCEDHLKTNGTFKKSFRDFYLSNPEVQEKCGREWFENLIDDIKERGLDKLIGKPLYITTGKPPAEVMVCPKADLNVLLAVAHLGGIGGLARFSNGHYNPHDGHTHLSEYAAYGYIIGMVKDDRDISPRAAIAAAYHMDRDKDYDYRCIAEAQHMETLPAKITVAAMDKKPLPATPMVFEQEDKNVFESAVDALQHLFQKKHKGSEGVEEVGTEQNKAKKLSVKSH